MNKSSTVFTFILIIFTIIGCNSGDKKGNTSTSDEAPTFNVVNAQEHNLKPAKQVNTNKQGNQVVENTPPTPPIPTPEVNRTINEGIPDACSLISTKDLALIYNLEESAISEKNASNARSPFTSSCFFRWDGEIPNTGILIQVQANPVKEEYDGWVTLYVSSKKTTGEKSMSSEESFIYSQLDGLGDDGAYSHRLGRYIWRVGNDFAFQINFHANSSPEDQLKKAHAIGKIMMKNYKG